MVEKKDKSLAHHLSEIQRTLKAPKGQYNKFGNYNYRSCEDILEALKDVLPDGLFVRVWDEIIQVGERYYVKATASISDGHGEISSPAFAREPLSKKGMDEAQITGSTSSYARKYALNALFCIDDTKDADATNDHKTGKMNPVDKTGNKDLDKWWKDSLGRLEVDGRTTLNSFDAVWNSIQYSDEYEKLTDEQRGVLNDQYDNSRKQIKTPQQIWLADAKKKIEELKTPEEIITWVKDNPGNNLSEKQVEWFDGVVKAHTAKVSQAPMEQRNGV